jgi:hypothetical protein
MPVLVLKQKCKSLLTEDGRWMPSDGNSSPGLSSLSIFSFIMAVSFIGLGNQSTWRESL